ncbi:MAG: hypothetical protein EXR29_04305 [Betaproteobacteria bacterium]|nr:hypothetical protein [Betaproteobacteria bacterium]
MSKDDLRTLAAGNVLGWVTGRAKVARDEWDATVDKIWPEFIAEMATNPGFKGAVACWTVETGEVSIFGIWSSVETRLAYEAKSAGTVRAIFNALLELPVKRHKQVISKVHWHQAG